jgi:hypothetical protein
LGEEFFAVSDLTKTQLQAAIEVGLRGAVAILLGVAGWAYTAVSDHERRLTIIESTRYTHHDARADREATQRELSKISELLSRLDERLHALQVRLEVPR